MNTPSLPNQAPEPNSPETTSGNVPSHEALFVPSSEGTPDVTLPSAEAQMDPSSRLDPNGADSTSSGSTRSAEEGASPEHRTAQAHAASPPAFWKHSRMEVLTGFGLVVFLAFFMKYFEFRGWLASLEAPVVNAFLKTAPSPASSNQKHLIEIAQNIITVTIDDAAYKDYFHSNSPLDPDKVVHLVGDLASAGPRVIGVDLMTDSVRYQSLHDRLRGPPFSPVPIVWAAGGAVQGADKESFPEWLFGHHSAVITPSAVLGVEPGPRDLADDRQRMVGGNMFWGLPVFPQDDDRAVRRFPRRARIEVAAKDVAKPQTPPTIVTEQETWARMVARHACGDNQACAEEDAEELLIPYSSGRNKPFSVCDVWTCDNWPEPDAKQREAFFAMVKDKIVLLGGTFATARDSHDTALGSTSGLELNAYAVQAEISGGIFELSRPMSLVLDIAIGFSSVMLFALVKWLTTRNARWKELVKPRLVRAMILFNIVALVLVIAIVAEISKHTLHVWFSWVGVLAGTLIGFVIDVWRENPVMRDEH
jgi:CHASE2 domain-containing sensor protein